MSEDHVFRAVAFPENFNLRDLAPVYGGARRPLTELHQSLPAGGEIFLYPFGVVTFHDVPDEPRARELSRLRAAAGHLSDGAIHEELSVREGAPAVLGMQDGTLVVDHLTPARAGVVALTVAQSAAMEYYEGIVEEMFVRTGAHVERLSDKGTVAFATRPLHRFIGEAVSTRSEVLSVLHFLDKPDATWDDPAMDEIYADLRDEFDLVDRFQALELKLRSVQESLELVLDVARDRRLVALEVAIVGLIVLEIVLSLLRAH